MSIRTTNSEMISHDARLRNAPSDSYTRLRGRWLLIARVAWLAVVALCVGVFVIAIPLRYDELASLSAPFIVSPDAARVELIQLGLSHGAYALYYLLAEVIFALGCCTVAAIIFARKSNDRMGLLISFTLVALGATFPSTIHTLAPYSEVGDRFVKLLNVLSIGSFMVTFYLFPDGRFAFRWTKWHTIIWVPLLATIVFLPGSLDDPNSLSSMALFPLVLGMVIPVIIAQSYRYRRISSLEERQQTRWVVFGVSIALTGLTATVVPPEIFSVLRQSFLLSQLLINDVRLFLMFLIPLSIGIAILRHRLYDIDILISRTLVYVPLTAILAGVFAGSITLSQKIFVALTGQSSDAATVLTTLIVVAVFDPLKNGLQHLVDRRFKEAPNPTCKLKTRGDQMRAVLQVIDVEQMTRLVLEDAVKAFDARGGAIFRDAGGAKPIQTFGDWNGDSQLSVPLQDNGATFGTLALGPRRNGAEYAAQDRAMLQEIADLTARAIAIDGRANGIRQ
jgi:hypothetical protein